MPHSLNTDSVIESMFVVQGLVHGSKSFCGKHKIVNGEENRNDYDWFYYFGWLKSQISERLIKSSITLRMLEDTLSEHQEDVDLNEYRKVAVSGLVLGEIQKGKFNLTLREAQNKIIHATDIALDWIEESDYEYWSGDIFLMGRKYKDEWVLKLNVESFAIATNRFINSLGEEVDWYHLYKYDT